MPIPKIRSRFLLPLFVSSLVAQTQPSAQAQPATQAQPAVQTQLADNAQPLDRAKLMQLVPFPKMEAGFSIGFTSNNAPPDDASARAEIATLEKLPPDDAPRLLRLGQLYSQIKDESLAKAKRGQAIALLMRESAANPQDASALLALGQALNQNNQLSEAETALRGAVKLAPQNALAWSQLGLALSSKALQDLVPTEGKFQFSLDSMPSIEQLGNNLLNFRPGPEAIAAAQKDLEEARNSYSHALLLAPRDFEVNSQNTGFQMTSAFLTALLRMLAESQTAQLKDTFPAATQAVSSAFFTESFFKNLQTLAELKPDNASLQGMAGMAAILGHLATQGGELPLEGGLEELPDETAAKVRAVSTKLETISNAGGKDAAAALESLGAIYFMTGNPAAVDRLQRSLALEPNRDQAYELLTGVLASADKFTELAAVVERRLKTQDTARNHLLLAKALDNLHRPADAAAQIELALQRDPNDVTANLAKAALLLRAGDAATASVQLVRISPVPDGQKLDYMLLEGVAFALQGKLLEARADWEKVLEKSSNHAAAKEMLELLPQP